MEARRAVFRATGAVRVQLIGADRDVDSHTLIGGQRELRVEHVGVLVVVLLQHQRDRLLHRIEHDGRRRVVVKLVPVGQIDEPSRDTLHPARQAGNQPGLAEHRVVGQEGQWETRAASIEHLVIDARQHGRCGYTGLLRQVAKNGARVVLDPVELLRRHLRRYQAAVSTAQFALCDVVTIKVDQPNVPGRQEQARPQAQQQGLLARCGQTGALRMCCFQFGEPRVLGEIGGGQGSAGQQQKRHCDPSARGALGPARQRDTAHHGVVPCQSSGPSRSTCVRYRRRSNSIWW